MLDGSIIQVHQDAMRSSYDKNAEAIGSMASLVQIMARCFSVDLSISLSPTLSRERHHHTIKVRMAERGQVEVKLKNLCSI